MKQFVFIITILLLSCSKQEDQPLPDSIQKDPEATLYKYRKDTKLPEGRRQLILGKCYANLNQEDSALACLIRAREFYAEENNREKAIDIGLDAYKLVSSQEDYDLFGKTYLDQYIAFARETKDPERLARSYNELAKNEADDTLPGSEERAQKLYLKALSEAKKTHDKMLLSDIYSNLGDFATGTGNFELARRYLDSSSTFSVKSKDPFPLFADRYNYANTYRHEGNYKAAFDHFLKADEVEIPYYKSKSKTKLYRMLADMADSLHDEKQRRKYERLFQMHEKEINRNAQNVAMRALELENDTFLLRLKEKIEHNRIVFFSLFSVAFLLALYSFIRWKKVDRNKKHLETAKQEIEIRHHQTVEQLEKVSQLVIEDHIVLQNKTKLYLEKLVYIKADDHYLHFVPVEGKSSFIRGKLSEINAQLPPNFKRCHRSYIVNINFIKSSNSRGIVLTTKEALPVSRDFKM